MTSDVLFCSTLTANFVEEAFALVGGADGGVRALSEGNVASAMRKIYAEREALGKTLSDTSDLVNNVGVMIAASLAVVVLFVSLGIFNVDVAGIWVLVSLFLFYVWAIGVTSCFVHRFRPRCWPPRSCLVPPPRRC